MRYGSLLLALTLIGCAHSRNQVSMEDGANPAGFRRIGVTPFQDSRGQGAVIAEKISAGLQQLFYEPVDGKALEKLLTQFKPNQDFGLGMEAMETIRRQTSADAILMGRMTPDWSAASISLVGTAMGDDVLHAILRPRGWGKKAFATPDEVAAEALNVITGKP